MLDQKTLDLLWNFEDPKLSEQRFREALADPRYDADERAELTTQLGAPSAFRAATKRPTPSSTPLTGTNRPSVSASCWSAGGS